jgi:mannose-6-phosphate isomerase-like protein (cupin superfamily)
VYLAEMQPGAAGPSLHVHEFDQYYVVLEGELTVEVGFERTVVGPNTLVVLPAGVPHRQFNAGDAVERHLAVNAPYPVSRPWDVAVELHTVGADS